MCTNLFRVFYCMRCSNEIYKETETAKCDNFNRRKRCGWNDIITSTKCESDLCLLCAAYPDTQEPFLRQPEHGALSTMVMQLRLNYGRK
ncbi:hypothetical protein F53441_12751 [Fusarium austroafricanum]|uniref:Uncharacterized protein n=1 Tax=Fusarium austroafricanum TaxID=2364996 RepID=A0A8H4NMT1_9HYPO|nr:hypothetical protein F53441_12751 [Fusarium austroafricanum]